MAHDLSKNKILKNLVFIILATTDVTTADEIYELWITHVVLKDYRRPSKKIIEEWVLELITPAKKGKK